MNNSPSEWESNWNLDEGHFVASGGRSIVRLVKNKTTGALGVLKELSQTDAKNSIRRARMNREVTALQAAEGPGIPKVLDHNTAQWKDNANLYVVMEYIEAKTLSQYSSGKPITLDDAISIVLKLSDILKRVHSQEVRHRDIKPDNVLIDNFMQPYLIDFGIAWSFASQNILGEDFITDKSEELGNRFLRLPEFMTGNEKRDPRSDITQLSSILLYLICGQAPRSLKSSFNELPDEALIDEIPALIKTDTRWVKLKRLFRVAFQTDIRLRFQNIESFIDALKAVTEPPPDTEDQFKRLEDIIDRLRAEMASSNRKNKEEIIDTLRGAHGAFLTAFDTEIMRCQLQRAGSGPRQINQEDKVISEMMIARYGTQEPNVKLAHYSEMIGGNAVLTWHVEQVKSQEGYFVGPIADKDTIGEKAAQAGRDCAAFCMEVYLERLKST